MIVIHSFSDLQDNNHLYHVGDEYPRHGLNVSEQRIAELSGSYNRQGKPLIKEEIVVEEKTVVEEKKRGRKPKTAK